MGSKTNQLLERVIFDPKTHTYVRESDGCRLMNASHFHKMFTPANWEHNYRKEAAQRYLKSRYKPLKDDWENNGGHILDPEFITHLMPFMHEETFLRICGEVKLEWGEEGERTSAEGSVNHEKEEKKTIEQGFCINPINLLSYPTQPHGKKEDGSNRSMSECICDYEPGFYPEALLWYFFPQTVYSNSMGVDICGVCGTSDKVFLEPDSSFVGDFKYTKKPLDDFAYSYPNHGYEMHTGAWADWRITKTSKYRIQLNFYGWILEQHGLPPKNLWLENHGKIIPIRYEPDRITSAIHDVVVNNL